MNIRVVLHVRVGIVGGLRASMCRMAAAATPVATPSSVSPRFTVVVVVVITVLVVTVSVEAGKVG